jgi:hypothetical protein
MVKKHPFRNILIITIMALLCLPALAFSQYHPNQMAAMELLRYYLDLLQTGNFESASQLWAPVSLVNATRLEISYDSIPVKPDCVSPLIYNYKKTRLIANPGIYIAAEADTGIIPLKYMVDVDGTQFTHFYYTQKIGEDFWLVYPQDYYCSKWLVRESKYFRFHIDSLQDIFYNDIGAKELDNFVEDIAAKIMIPSERLKLLAEKKINYYLCKSEDEVGRFSGKATKGFYDLGSDAIITSIFPHFHEVAHLLINFKFQNLPLFTLLSFQEGTAVYLGGRWQRTPEVMIDFGRYILKYGVTEIDSVLMENDSAETVASDISYPVSACLCEYLFETLGQEKFFELYRSLSGDYDFIKNVGIEDTKKIIADACGKSWADLKISFDKFLASRQPSGGLIFPGEISGGKPLIKDSSLTISASDKWLSVEYIADSVGKADINILFEKTTALDKKASTIFLEQYKTSRPFDGYRYGIRLDKNEIGLYDYATNQLLAKYVYDFDPSPKYYDSTSNRYRAYFDIKLLDKNLPRKSDYMIIK